MIRGASEKVNPIKITSDTGSGFDNFSKQGFSVIIGENNGKLELVKMTKEEPLEKSTSGQPRVV